MPHRPNVPIRIQGIECGTAHVNDDGTVELKLGENNNEGKELLEHIRAGIVFGLSISPILNPGIDGKLITRVEQEKKLPIVGSWRFRQHDGHLHPFHD